MELCHLCIFAILVGSFIYFLQDAKYVSMTFLSEHRLAEIYTKSNLCKSSITDGELLYSTAHHGTYRHGNYICVLLSLANRHRFNCA
jgi:hypothetical protein